MTNALGKTSLPNDTAAANQPAGPTKPKKEWVGRKAYDYEKYMNKPSGGTGAADESHAWASNAPRYEWDGEFGDVPPVHAELEKILFQREFAVKGGENFSQLLVEVTQVSEVKVNPIKEFKDAGLHPVVLDTITRLLEYDAPTPVQSYVIPAVIEGKDVIACAQTGSGKTAAYLIPILSKLMGKWKKLAAPRPPSSAHMDIKNSGVRAEPLVLVIAPSRELALQIFDEARKLCYRTMLRPCCIYGGAPTGPQREDLFKGCDLLVATPGRLVDLMNQPRVIALDRLKYTVIDEADELVQDDWEESLGRIMASGESNANEDHSFLMFSATFPKNARILANEYMSTDYVRLRVGRAGSTHRFIQQRVVWVEDNLKQGALKDLLYTLPPARTLIFVNSRRMADLLDDFLYNSGLPSTSMHSDRTQREREDALRNFRLGNTPIMVTTGVSARGIDIAHVMHVVNYDMPSAMHGGIDEYVHRIGRTARIGNRGMATSFYNDRNDDIGDELTKILVECHQQIPDFLQSKMPEGELIFEHDDNDDDKESPEGLPSADAGPNASADAGAGFGGDSGSNGNDGWKADGNGEDEEAGGADLGGAW
ncbi:DEAD/DEAH box RNA helicase [Viridothelium virens]|uniref:RNA helicase n=1 Tax=Viridothelium virens TaxID=1048519 RepID=A0A6A6GZI1_VIRVR|nr:DEAD/DEAH box RNA helicase [Viridothelium virens]